MINLLLALFGGLLFSLGLLMLFGLGWWLIIGNFLQGLEGSPQPKIDFKTYQKQFKGVKRFRTRVLAILLIFIGLLLIIYGVGRIYM